MKQVGPQGCPGMLVKVGDKWPIGQFSKQQFLGAMPQWIYADTPAVEMS
jgi:hypothetical protein